MRIRLALAVIGLTAAVVTRLPAQNEAAIEQLAPILRAEDSRDFSLDFFTRAMGQPDPVVRREALRALGRIRDARGIPLLVAALRDRDSTLVADAAFALGQLADTTTLSALTDRLADNTLIILPDAVVAIVTAITKIGGPAAGAACAGILSSSGFAADSVTRNTASRTCVLEGWRLGRAAPLEQLRPFLNSDDDGTRSAAFYTIGRLHRPADADQMMSGLHSGSGPVATAAARALTSAYADSAHLDRETVTRQLGQLTSDPSNSVRIQALRSLGTYQGLPVARWLAPLLEDQTPNVAVTAAQAIGASGDTAGTKSLLRVLDGKGTYAVRRAALVSLAQLNSPALGDRIKPWLASADWRDRAAAADAFGAVKPMDPAPLVRLLADADSRVAGAALQNWSDGVAGPEPALVAAARKLLSSRDPVLRSISADIVARAADPADLPLLKRALIQSARDSIPDAALSALSAIQALGTGGEAGKHAVETGFLETEPRPSDYLLRRWAADHWPELADRWAPIEPVETHRTLQDYRDAARLLVAESNVDARPHLFIETPKGRIEIELAGPDAPLTVLNFLRLADRHYFDNQRWHRVVPGFVAQAGDPRGDGWGGPGWAIRDEVNALPYGTFALGMALSGPETGGSQWFITLDPAPHLNGIYTVFGRVVSGANFLLRVSQGDLITSIHR